METMLPQNYGKDAENVGSNVLWEKTNGVLWVTLNRPKTLNAMNSSVVEQLQHVWLQASTDSFVHSIVLIGAGPEAFCIGFDPVDPPTGNELAPYGEHEPVRITPKECGIKKRFIVLVNGILCHESFRFVRDADVVIASHNSLFFEPQAMLTLSSSRWLGRLSVNMNKSTLRNPVTAAEAKDCGLVHEVVPLASLRSEGTRIAQLDRRAPAEVHP